MKTSAEVCLSVRQLNIYFIMTADLSGYFQWWYDIPFTVDDLTRVAEEVIIEEFLKVASLLLFCIGIASPHTYLTYIQFKKLQFNPTIVVMLLICTLIHSYVLLCSQAVSAIVSNSNEQSGPGVVIAEVLDDGTLHTVDSNTEMVTVVTAEESNGIDQAASEESSNNRPQSSTTTKRPAERPSLYDLVC